MSVAGWTLPPRYRHTAVQRAWEQEADSALSQTDPTFHRGWSEPIWMAEASGNPFRMSDFQCRALPGSKTIKGVGFWSLPAKSRSHKVSSSSLLYIQRFRWSWCATGLPLENSILSNGSSNNSVKPDRKGKIDFSCLLLSNKASFIHIGRNTTLTQKAATELDRKWCSLVSNWCPYGMLNMLCHNTGHPVWRSLAVWLYLKKQKQKQKSQGSMLWCSG